MARFRFCLIGSSQAPVLEVAAHDIHDLHDKMSRSRFIAGEMVEADESGVIRGVLIATSRVQLVMEAD